MLAADIRVYRPNIVVALGGTALWALTGLAKISEFRGYVMESTLVNGVKVIGTYHPRFIIENWKESFTVVMDLRKAVRESSCPEIKQPG